MFDVFSRSALRVLQATLILSLSIPSLLSLLPGANAAPTPDPSAPTAPQQRYETPSEQPTSSSRSSHLPVSALLAIVGASLFLLLLGTTLACMYVRRRRVNHKRAEHRKRTAQFQEMYRSGARPYFFAHGGSAPAPAPVPVSQTFSATASEKRGPRYPIKAYVV